MLRQILLFYFLASSSGFIMKLPGYITFDTNYYNTTYCNNSLNNYHTTHYENVCFGSVSNCCNNILQETSYLPNSDLDTCYTEIVNNNTVSYFYHCEETNLNKNQSLIVKFSIIGFIFLSFATIITIFSWWWCCKRERYTSGYGKIN